MVTGNILRDKVVRRVDRGKRKWKRAVGYGRRWLVEGFFSAFKRWFGEFQLKTKYLLDKALRRVFQGKDPG